MPKRGTVKAGFRVPCPALQRGSGKASLHWIEVWLSPSCRLFAFCRPHGSMLFLNGELFRSMVRGAARLKLLAGLPSRTLEE